MIDLLQLQKRVYENKIAQGFNVTDIYMKFCYMQTEIAEAIEAYALKKDGVAVRIE
jgi:hypothetical protein